ncbi:hypothetical protein HMPREF2132_01715 [Prevotella histicola JCM 15637 = DNF00424]|uniref:Nucleoside 2-deoxyribosyltransferase n=2 Tax=Prevotella histicola TaxID=470565 RepID=A0AAW3FHB1_9BACT|nr:hypothetical protein HMPREF2132_01715 [Prevotella histicola JCM 15637 = DNF00424]
MPISGRPIKEEIAEGKRIVKTLSAAHPNWEIINPLDISAGLPKEVWNLSGRKRYAAFMGADIEALLGEADAVAFTMGAIVSKGCRLELCLANVYDLPRIFLDAADNVSRVEGIDTALYRELRKEINQE